MSFDDKSIGISIKDFKLYNSFENSQSQADPIKAIKIAPEQKGAPFDSMTFISDQKMR